MVEEGGETGGRPMSWSKAIRGCASQAYTEERSKARARLAAAAFAARR